jgi:pimeloyl-ACP methyl ester carboxylesterase
MTADRFVEVPGGKIYVKIWNPVAAVDSRPLILIHDSLGCVRLWRDFPNLLCEKLQRPIIAYDRLGFGQSTKREGLPSKRFISEEAEAILPALLSSQNINQFDLYGYSVGGAMAIACAALHEDRCHSILTEATQAFVEDKTI